MFEMIGDHPRSVWSLWTKPLEAGLSNWISELHHLLGWVLSVETARRHYPRTSLVTDDLGAEILIEGVGLQFEHVSTALNDLDRHDPYWWSFGKIYAYRLQSEPFVHIDSDVFLWSPLPARLERADVFAQNPEHFVGETNWYHPENFRSAIRSVGGWLPAELDRPIPIGSAHKAVCCGIFGANRVDFVQSYADLAITMMDHPANQPAWPLLVDKRSVSLIFEQYLLAACLEYHENKSDSPYNNMAVEYLFESEADAYARAHQEGYTHLTAAKRDKRFLYRLENRVKKDYPEYYERCVACVDGSPAYKRLLGRR